MLIKVCETLGPLYKDNRMNSKIISKCCATCTVLEHFFCHKTPVTDVRYKDGLWMFDEYEMLRPMKGKLNKVKLDELRTLHDQTGRSLRTCFLGLFLGCFLWTENLVFFGCAYLSKQVVFRKGFFAENLGEGGGP